MHGQSAPFAGFLSQQRDPPTLVTTLRNGMPPRSQLSWRATCAADLDAYP